MAYVVHEHGEQKLMDFYQDIHTLSYDENFIKHFGKDYRSYVEDFETFLLQDPEQLMAILP